ncbi:post-transcriptional regulator [Calidifontibacillus oryziterrae]|uniref:post-transcriptional regulator n=1 Tax=Calidifontibacillus oryziterrae TaxID=1191699 RepID=UPI000300E6D2|nr:post-transcriptional regulator [Calidifontibacillus oryziterrae]
MVSRHPVEFYKEQVQPALESKLEEFKLMGYDRVSLEEIWDCLQKKKWKKKTDKSLHEIVSDILTLKINDYMSYLTIEAYKAPDFFAQYENDKDMANN